MGGKASTAGLYKAGDKVELCNFRNKPEMNGRTGVIQQASKNKPGNWDVKVDSNTILSVKESNLRIASSSIQSGGSNNPYAQAYGSSGATKYGNVPYGAPQASAVVIGPDRDGNGIPDILEPERHGYGTNSPNGRNDYDGRYYASGYPDDRGRSGRDDYYQDRDGRSHHHHSGRDDYYQDRDGRSHHHHHHESQRREGDYYDDRDGRYDDRDRDPHRHHHHHHHHHHSPDDRHRNADPRRRGPGEPAPLAMAVVSGVDLDGNGVPDSLQDLPPGVYVQSFTNDGRSGVRSLYEPGTLVAVKWYEDKHSHYEEWLPGVIVMSRHIQNLYLVQLEPGSAPFWCPLDCLRMPVPEELENNPFTAPQPQFAVPPPLLIPQPGFMPAPMLAPALTTTSRGFAPMTPLPQLANGPVPGGYPPYRGGAAPPPLALTSYAW